MSALETTTTTITATANVQEGAWYLGLEVSGVNRISWKLGDWSFDRAVQLIRLAGYSPVRLTPPTPIHAYGRFHSFSPGKEHIVLFDEAEEWGGERWYSESCRQIVPDDLQQEAAAWPSIWTVSSPVQVNSRLSPRMRKWIEGIRAAHPLGYDLGECFVTFAEVPEGVRVLRYGGEVR